MKNWILITRERFADIPFREGEALCAHTTFRVGGKCALFAEPENGEQLSKLYCFAKDNGIPVFVLGRGSNLLVSDDGFDGLVISTAGMNAITVSGNEITAACGVPLSKIALCALHAGLGGAEFCHGIPGSLGGAVFMNAGAYERSMADIVSTVRMIENGSVVAVPGREMEFGYRRSRAMRNGGIVLSAVLTLTPGDETEIEERMRALDRKRSDKQPLEFPSAGSYFKRPEGYFAGALIDQAGLKGFAVGGAQVSEKHAGFIVNRGGATCRDILTLEQEIVNRVEERFHVRLEREVRLIENELFRRNEA
ncbi:MAG: UDP-N-acetylmuramate dehydrogenase [Clostridia bacterium]|nr:UDP-N-acetylmuramate dehydrogenase [Clostridia bacterium]